MDSGADSVRAEDAMRLVLEWEHRARRAFMDAQALYATGTMERRFVEHGARVYFNCAQELRASIQDGPGLRPSATRAAR
jgi:hypothetical protein